MIDLCFFKQKTEDGVHISDWSSDVCSSDLRIERLRFTALDRDAALAQRVDDAFEQRLRQPRQGLDGQFFGAEFDEQGCGVGHRSKASCLCLEVLQGRI